MIFFVFQEWGADLPPEMSKLLPAASSSSSSSLPVLVVGSDLLYCAAVVRPLMRTVKDILVDRKGSSSGVGRFILVSSFDTGDDVEVEMVAAASECGFEISEICKLDTTRSICRIQIVTVPLNGGSAEKVGFTIDKDIFAVRYSHMDFFSRRNFSVVPKFWRAALHILDSSQLPTCIRGDGVFGLSDLLHIHESGLSEYVSEDTK